jgi:hypothetical protein
VASPELAMSLAQCRIFNERGRASDRVERVLKPHAKDAKDAKKESSFRPELEGGSSGKPLTMRSIPFLRWTSPKLIFGVFGGGIRIHGAQELAGDPVLASLYSGKARPGLKSLVWVFSLASLASLA